MTEADREAVGLIGIRAWQSSSAFEDAYLDPIVIERVRGEFQLFARETDCDVVIAEIGGIVIGWGARAGEPDYISDIWVDPDYQGRGIGRLLDEMRRSHLPTAKIATHARNVNAIRAYERCGFRIVWQGAQWSESMKVELQKVRLEKPL